jgi:hypothetical protein
VVQYLWLPLGAPGSALVIISKSTIESRRRPHPSRIVLRNKNCRAQRNPDPEPFAFGARNGKKSAKNVKKPLDGPALAGYICL